MSIARRLAVLLLLGGVSWAGAADWTLPALMAVLAARGEAVADFRETRSSALLSEPLVLEGVLTYRAPDYLHKQVRQPFLRSFEVSGNDVTIDNGQPQPRRLRLHDVPPLASLVSALRAVLGGDEALLHAHYDAALVGSRDGWTLTLTPLDAGVARRVSNIVVEGDGAQVRHIVTREVGGGGSQMRLQPRAE